MRSSPLPEDAPLIGGDGRPQARKSRSIARHALVPGRQRAYSPRQAHTRARADYVRDVFLPDVAAEGIVPSLRATFYVLVHERLSEKSEKGYDDWKDQSLDMRKGGWIPLDAFSDAGRERVGGDGYEGPLSAYLDEAVRRYTLPLWAAQPVVPELWHEADTHAGIFGPVAARWRVTRVSTHGDSSLPPLIASARAINARYAERGQCTLILYFGDHDAAGVMMSERLHGRLVEMGMTPDACTVVRIAVTTPQIRTLGLPTRFSTHSPRDKKAEWYERTYPNVGYVDLDAVPPRRLVALADEAIRAAIADEDAWQQAIEQEEEAMLRGRIFLAAHQAEIDALQEMKGDGDAQDEEE